MRPGKFLITATVMVSLAVVTTGGKKRKKDATPLNISDLIQPTPQLYLRAAFDSDPSMYLGRWVPNDMEPVDESAAFQTRCGQYIEYREVTAAGHYEQFFLASSDSLASVGIPVVGGVGAEGESSTMVRATYDLTRKLVADIPPDQIDDFEACCKRADDQCADRYIGEFIEGTGAIYQALGRAGEGGADVVARNGVGVDLEVSRGVQWQRAITFETPIYFAMKTTLNRFVDDKFESCVAARAKDQKVPGWVHNKPTSSQGRYYIGIGTPHVDEGVARDTAHADVIQQIALETGIVTQGGSFGRESGVQGMTMDIQNAIARQTTVEASCPTIIDTPEGEAFHTKVLVFITEEAWLENHP